MTWFALALVALGALAWDGWRRWLVVRSVELAERVDAVEAAVLKCAKSEVVDAELKRCAEEIARINSQMVFGAKRPGR